MKRTYFGWHRLLCAAFMFALLAGCFRSEQAQSGPNFENGQPDGSSAVVDGIEKSAPPIDGELDPARREELVVEVETGDLLRLLAQLDVEQQRVSNLPAQRRLQVQRSVAAARLLNDSELTTQQRFKAIRTNMDALLRLSGLGDSDAPHRVRAFSQSYLEDEDQRVAQAASVALLISELSDYLKESGQDLTPWLTKAESVVHRFPDSYNVAKELYDMAEGLIQSNRREDGIKWLTMLSSNGSRSQDPQVQQLATYISDRVQMLELGFDLALADIRTDKPGAVDQFLQNLAQLVSSAAFSARLFGEVNRSLDTLERNHRYAVSREANRVLLESAGTLPDRELGQLVSHHCTLRQNRLDLIGQPIQFAATTARSEPLDWSRYHGKWVVVAFWSTADPSSMQLVRQLGIICELKHDQGLELLTVNLSPDLRPLKTLFGSQLPSWEIVVSDQPGATGTQNILATKFGVSSLPYLLIVDRQGNVSKVGVPPASINREIEALLAHPEE